MTLASLALVAAACGGSKSSTSKGASATTAPTPATTGAASTAPTGSPYYVALSTTLSGSGADFSVPTQHGAELAVADVNAAGGINGHPLKMEEYDDKGDPTTAADIAHKIVDDQKVLAVLGNNLSTTGTVALPITSAAGLATISFNWLPVATSTAQGYRVSMDYAVSGGVLTAILKNGTLKNVKTIDVWTTDQPTYAKSNALIISQIKAATGITAKYVYYTPGSPDLSAPALQLFNDKPDLVYDAGNDGATTSEPMKQVQRLGGLPHTVWIGPTYIIPTTPSSNGPAVVAGGVSVTFVDFTKPEVKALAAKVKAKYNNEALSYGQVQGYDAINLIAAAMKAPGATDSRANLQAAMDALKNVPVVGGPAGYTVSFSPGAGNGHEAFADPKAYLYVQLQKDGSLGAYQPA